MKHNRILSMVTAALIAATFMSSCSGVKKLKDMEITSAHIYSIVPVGLRGADLGLHVGIDNPGIQITLSEISCDVKRSGKIIGKVAVDPVTLHARTEEVYDVDATIKLAEGATILDLGRLFDKGASDDILLDLHTKVRLKSGVAKTLVFNDVPLKKLIQTVKR